MRVDSFFAEGVTEADVDHWAQSASMLHSNGDAMDIAVRNDQIVGVRGRGVDRVNHGRLGVKDLFGWQANASRDRLTRPLVRRGDELVETSWDDAMGRIADRAKADLSRQGPSALGFYTTGQLFLEEYYTLGIIAHGGIGTPHLDGNTRLCTATAAAALKESFGNDGQPGSYTDIDHADVIALFGHNMAETQSVLWMRILDRLEGSDPPTIICVDPRMTPVAKVADVHLAPRPGTNLALVNSLLHEIVTNGWYDKEYVESYTVGFEELEKTVKQYPPEYAAAVCDVPVEDIRTTARILGSTNRLLSTVLQGFYQSHQATASAVQVNNIHIIRGMLGKPGAGLLQMNGQPSAQNTRESGADGDLAGFRNWGNTDQVAELARLWNVETNQIPHHSPPTHVMSMMHYAETGSISFLWIIGTNPAVSLPELARIRKILEKPELFVVVSDLFLSETAQFADVVLPAAAWGEKTGAFTNVDRTVHISEQAIQPPGEARSDLHIFVDFARHLDLRGKDGSLLIPWTEPEQAFEAWKECSAGRPCDYSAMSYDKLRGGSGIQWPCTTEHPSGTERLYGDGKFLAQPEYCEDYGHDLLTGAVVEKTEYEALNPEGRAIIKAAHYQPPHEQPSEDFPFILITGRTIYHFHTRTKTGRAPQLNRAAPDIWVEVSQNDALRLSVDEGDLLEVQTARGSILGRARISGIRNGVVFVPFHYGYWDTQTRREPGKGGRAANELTITDWDPVSKQPLFKTASAKVVKRAASDGTPSPAPTTAASAPVTGRTVAATVGGRQATASEERQ